MWPASKVTSSEGRQVKAYSIGQTILGKLSCPERRKRTIHGYQNPKRLTERLPPTLVDNININNFLITQLVSWAVLKLHNHLKL